MTEEQEIDFWISGIIENLKNEVKHTYDNPPHFITQKEFEQITIRRKALRDIIEYLKKHPSLDNEPDYSSPGFDI
jgi:hypothetical protein